MTKRIDFIFDFASLNAYLAERALSGLIRRTEATINVIPCLLGGIFKATGNQAPFTAFAGVKGKIEYEILEIRRFVTAHGLEDFQMNPHFPVNSLLAMRGLCACEPGEEFDRYLDVVLAGFWERGLLMSDPAVLSAVLTKPAWIPGGCSLRPRPMRSRRSSRTTLRRPSNAGPSARPPSSSAKTCSSARNGSGRSKRC